MRHDSAAVLVSGSPADLLPAFPPIPSWVPDVVAAITIGLGVIAVLLTTWGVFKGVAALARKAKTSNTAGEDLLTWGAAAIATGVSAQGMWRFAGDILGFDGPLRIMLFAFIEVAMFTSAVRAKRNMRENFSAGIDGMAVWVLTCLSAVLSCMDARSIPEAVFRLAAPLVAAWLWERGMAIERHRATGRKRIHWRFTLERVLVYIGLAEAQDRTAEEVDAQRRLTKVSLAAKKARRLRDAGASDRKQRAALAKLDTAFERAAEHAGLARDPEVQKRVRAETASLYSAAGLLDITPASEWMPAAAPSDFERLAEETRQLNESLAAKHGDRASMANLLMLASLTTGQRLVPVTSDVTSSVTHTEVTPGVTKEVTDPPFFPPREWLDEAAGVTSDVTSNVTGNVTSEQVTQEVTEEVTFDVTDPTMFDVRWPPLDLSDVTTPVTNDVTSDEVTDEVTEEVTATTRMREHWDASVANDMYPTVTELAEVGGLRSHSYPSRLREKWVSELPWHQRRKAKAIAKKAVNGSKPS